MMSSKKIIYHNFGLRESTVLEFNLIQMFSLIKKNYLLNGARSALVLAYVQPAAFCAMRILAFHVRQKLFCSESACTGRGWLAQKRRESNNAELGRQKNRKNDHCDRCPMAVQPGVLRLFGNLGQLWCMGRYVTHIYICR